MSDGFAENFTRAFQQGREQRRQEAQDVRDDEERQLRIATLKHAQRTAELEGRFRAFQRQRTGAQEAAQSLEGRPLSELLTSPQLAPLFEQGYDQTGETLQAPTPPPPTRRTVDVPGSEEFGIQGFRVQPHSLEERLDAQLTEQLMKPTMFGPGQTMKVPLTGQELASGPPPAQKDDTRSIDVQAAEALTRGDTATYEQLKRVKREMREPPDPVAQQVAQLRLDMLREKATGQGDIADRALAEMAASNPYILKGLTPTEIGKVRQAIAVDPTLRQQFSEASTSAIRAPAANVISALDDLLERDAQGRWQLSGGAKSIYGKGPGRIARFIPGTQAATAKAALDQVTGTLTLDLLAQMKAQSQTGATGFGQLSERELSVIEGAATVLKGEISEPRALQELIKMRDRFDRIIGTATAPAARPQAAPASPKTAPAQIGEQRDFNGTLGVWNGAQWVTVQ